MTGLAEFGLLRLDRVSPTGFRLEVRTELSTPFGRLYGGVGVAGCAEAAERVTGRSLQWITTQFIGPAVPSDTVHLEVAVQAHGATTSQSQVVGSVDGRSVFVALCAHSARPVGDLTQFVEMPDVPGPQACGRDPFGDASAGSFLDRIERRWAANRIRPGVFASSGRCALWCRLRGDVVGSAATQAFVSDIIPLAVCAALGAPPGGVSLDHTVRVIDPTPSEWVLLDMSPDGFQRSTGHGSLRLWSETGRLMGTAQQSAIIRER